MRLDADTVITFLFLALLTAGVLELASSTQSREVRQFIELIRYWLGKR